MALGAVGLLAGEIDGPPGLVDALDAADGELGVGQLLEELARGEVVEVDLAIAAPLRGPQEARVVLEEDEVGRFVDVAGVGVGQEETGLPGGRVGREELDLVLEPVQAVVGEFPAVVGPLAPIEVDVEVVARLQPDDLLGRDVDDEQPDDGVVRARHGIALELVAGHGGDIVDDGILGHRELVELHEGDLLRIGRPPEGLILGQLLRVDPVRVAVAEVLGAVGRQGRLGPVHVLDVEVVAAGEGPVFQVGGQDVAVGPAADAGDGPLRLVGNELRGSQVVDEDLVEGLEGDPLAAVEVLEAVEEQLDLLAAGRGVDRGQELGVVEQGRFGAREDVGPLEGAVLEGVGALAVRGPGEAPAESAAGGARHPAALALKLFIEGLADDLLLGEGLPDEEDDQQKAGERGRSRGFSHDVSPWMLSVILRERPEKPYSRFSRPFLQSFSSPARAARKTSAVPALS